MHKSSLLQEDTTHVVVVFLDDSGKKTKDVPRSWLTIFDRKIMCYYLNESDYTFLDERVSKGKVPDENN